MSFYPVLRAAIFGVPALPAPRLTLADGVVSAVMPRAVPAPRLSLSAGDVQAEAQS